MPLQHFYASPADTFTWPNGAVGHRPGGSFDCLGPYAKVRNCPIEGTDLRLTCYAQGYADTYFSIPAATRIAGHHVRGFFTIRDNGLAFVPYDSALPPAQRWQLITYDSEGGKSVNDLFAGPVIDIFLLKNHTAPTARQLARAFSVRGAFSVRSSDNQIVYFRDHRDDPLVEFRRVD